MEQSNFDNQQIVINKQLPQNFLAEKTILSCLLINYEAIEITIQTLPVDAFYFKHHQELYKTILFMYQNQIPVDVLTLATYLQDNGLLFKIGGVKVLIELTNEIPNLTYLEDYIQLVKDKFIRRRLIQLGNEVINSGYITNIPLEKILNELENKVFNLTNEIKPQTLVSSAELLTDIFSKLNKNSLNPSLPGLSSGFYELDSLTQGFQKSELIIIAGRPGMGKTALGLNIALNILKNYKLPVLFFSLEMAKEQIMYRVLSMETNINQVKLKNGKLYTSDWLKLNKIVNILSECSFFLDDTPNLSVQKIRSDLKTILFEHNNIGIIIIDYLQLLQSAELKNENRTQELSKITRSLKILAREFNVPIIALSQLSRSIESRVDKRPLLSDLRESGSIEQDADLVLMLSKQNSNNTEDYDYQTIELIIAKQRNGPLGTVKLKFDEKFTKFIDIEK